MRGAVCRQRIAPVAIAPGGVALRSSPAARHPPLTAAQPSRRRESADPAAARGCRRRSDPLDDWPESERKARATAPCRRGVLLGGAFAALSGAEALATSGSLFAAPPGAGGRGLFDDGAGPETPGSAGSLVYRLPRAGVLWEREPPVDPRTAGPGPRARIVDGPAERRIRMLNAHTGERIDLRYMARGRHDPEALAEFSRFARDWRENAVAPIDPVALDIVHAVAERIDAPGPMVLLSGYRTERTNRSLKGAAPDSLHMRGMALDITHPHRSVEAMARAAMTLGAGGVGRYDRSRFIHVDSGAPRTWRA